MEHIPEALFNALMKNNGGAAKEKPKNQKFNNEIIDDPTHGKFDSRHEFDDYIRLIGEQKSGRIRNLERQTTFSFGDEVTDKWLMTEGRKHPNGKITHRQKIRYIADFTYDERDSSGEWVYVVQDSKGFVTNEYKLKRAMMEYFHGILIKET